VKTQCSIGISNQPHILNVFVADSPARLRPATFTDQRTKRQFQIVMVYLARERHEGRRGSLALANNNTLTSPIARVFGLDIHRTLSV
jgi:hypothetical protein